MASLIKKDDAISIFFIRNVEETRREDAKAREQHVSNTKHVDMTIEILKIISYELKTP